jgi:hypothetical protein
MAEEYKGPERRSSKPTRRRGADPTAPSLSAQSSDRRYARDYSAGRSTNAPAGNMLANRRTEGVGIVEVKNATSGTDRRISGAGRRSGDLARALDTGESAIYQFGKGIWANAGKLAEKVIKKKLKLGP